MRSASNRRTSFGLGLCGLLAVGSAACTAPLIVHHDASGQAGTTGQGGDGVGGQAGDQAGAGGGGAGGQLGTAGQGGGGAGGRGGTSQGGTGGGGISGQSGTTGQGGVGGSAAGVGGSAPGGTGGAIGGSGGPSGSGGGGQGGAGGMPTGVTPTVAGQLVITELMHDTDVVGDDFGEWFEVYNPDPAITYNLYGCQIRDTANMHTVARHVLVPPMAFRTFAIFLTGGGFVPDYTYSGVKFSNSSADLVRIVCGSTIIDEFAYTLAQAGSGSGHSFSLDPRHYTATDNDDPANVCLASTVYNTAVSGGGPISDYGTPGADNPPCP